MSFQINTKLSFHAVMFKPVRLIIKKKLPDMCELPERKLYT